ncbi:hypothetical protein Pla22_51990 [Rubripirellula amarantea]|uniref:Uncharacterized protein n=1 Tax=Rubripirellula amarantea TaxID=2527999 RepID=A0A5C5WCT1_9BACT|nr:hypothetical protein Pla22_51990 [Rubripirellula amarantea]
MPIPDYIQIEICRKIKSLISGNQLYPPYRPVGGAGRSGRREHRDDYIYRGQLDGDPWRLLPRKNSPRQLHDT